MTTTRTTWRALNEALPGACEALLSYMDIPDPNSLTISTVADIAAFCSEANGVKNPQGLVVFVGEAGEIGDSHNAPRITMTTLESAMQDGEIRGLVLVDYTKDPLELVVLYKAA